MAAVRVAHLTTSDISLRYLVLPQLLAVAARRDEAIGISGPGPHVAELEAMGIRHVTLASSTRSMNPLADVRAAFELYRLLRRERIDVLHTHNPKPGVYGRIVGRLAGVPVVVNTVHGLYATPEDRLARRLVVYGLEAVASRFSDAELVQNEEDLALLVRHGIVARRKARLLGNGVQLDRFVPRPEHRDAVRAALGIAPDVVAIGFVGRLVAEKGLRELFAAAEELAPDAIVLVVGPTDTAKADAITADTIEAAARAGVRFLGMRDDVEDLYQAMDVFALPSYREGFPRAAMEAAASGVAIVATDIRGCRQVVRPGENGLLVPRQSAGALTDALRELVADPARRERMGRAGRALAEQHFDESVIVATVLSTYDRLSRPRRRRLGLAKRAFDMVVAAIVLVVTSPLLALVAVAVRLRLGRPVLFRQVRPGLDGAPFTVLKFRTMTDRRDANGDLLPDDARLTRFGRLLRSTSIDELPELVNVWRGEMSLVGPRPLLTDYLDRYTREQARRHDVRPGITGWAQVNGRNASTWPERLAQDVWYVDHRSFWLDLRILAKTVGAVVRREGISAAGQATMEPFRGTSNDV
jgi:lipopolysaccharide/colanic/teichoic acid biosynthesis glycosyltransferase